ncbi:type VI immunity family protein [Corallococcus sp. AB045]|uniref:type VI immunity family protein n=1 Tax=Corallococcus sp. AB045 TaxID=2316719 RepID=UPI001315546D|nr:type VI immunity family protein [Corallococcus sp. AB045]
MTREYPIIRLWSKGSPPVPAARDGVILSFLIHRNHKEIAVAVWRALQLYLRAIPPGSLGWYDTDDGDILELDDKSWEVVRQQMLERPRGQSGRAGLSESPGGGEVSSGFFFEYRGRPLDNPFDTDPVCTVSFAFPTNYIQGNGAEHLRALALELARELPFNFGYASFAIISSHGMWSAAKWALVEALLARYPGLDLHGIESFGSILGTRALGPSWLTFLGQPLLGQLGGIDTLRNALPFPEVSLLPMDGDRVLVTLDDWPDPIDTQTKAIPPQYRALARLMEPFLFQYEGEGLPLYKHDTNQWLRRFL